jgi:hypothetical protein
VKRVVVAVALAVATSCACGGGTNEYVEANERLLAELPVYPSAAETRITSASYVGEEGGEVLGYTTNVVYEVRPGTTARQVIEFYVRELQRTWSYELNQFPIFDTATGQETGNVLIADFTQGEAALQVNTDGIAAGGEQTFELVVDHAGSD